MPEDWPATAEALMRSRFAAFKNADTEWLLASWHPSTRPAELTLDRDLQWRKLQIVDTEAGGLQDSDGIVEFNASYVSGGRFAVHRERSTFVREDGRWYYVDAI